MSWRLAFLHRALVPEAYEVSVGVLQLGPVAPVRLARGVHEVYAALRPLGVGGLDVVDLEPERAPQGVHPRGDLLEKEREVVAILERDGRPLRHLKLQGEAEGLDVPAARARQVRDRNPQMVKAQHGDSPPMLARAAPGRG